MILANEKNPKNLSFVSIFSREILIKIQEMARVKAKAWRIIHYEMLYTDLLGLQATMERKKRIV